MTERDRLYELNYHYETAGNWSEVSRWFGEHLALMHRFEVTEHVREVLDICESAGTLLPRE
ncbi:MAG TPA: hypothetical protein PK765_05780 [bacterium]|nr:hypothetical protein [bacterium]